MFLRSLVKVNNSVLVWNFAPEFSEDQRKKVFAAFWFYFSSEFRISCCQLDITNQKNQGGQIYFTPSSVRPEGVLPPKLMSMFFHIVPEST